VRGEARTRFHRGRGDRQASPPFPLRNSALPAAPFLPVEAARGCRTCGTTPPSRQRRAPRAGRGHKLLYFGMDAMGGVSRKPKGLMPALRVVGRVGLCSDSLPFPRRSRPVGQALLPREDRARFSGLWPEAITKMRAGLWPAQRGNPLWLRDIRALRTIRYTGPVAAAPSAGAPDSVNIRAACGRPIASNAKAL
jgi:hypothetical protein